MRDVSFFANNFYNELKNKKKFLAFVITGNKPILSEVLLAHLINKQLEDKFNQNIKTNILHIMSCPLDFLFFLLFLLSERLIGNLFFVHLL